MDDGIPVEWLQEEPQQIINRAGKLLLEEDPTNCTTARRLCEIVMGIDRGNAGLVYMVGTSYMRQSRWAFAEQWFRRAVDLDDNFAPAWNNLGWCYQQEGRNDEAKAMFHKAADLAPTMAEVKNNLATLYVNNGTPEEAIKQLSAALKLAPDNPDAQWNLGLANLEKKNWAEGWAGYRAGMINDVRSSQKRKLRIYPQHKDMPYWDGEKNQKLVIYGEQGVGDEILGASMLADVAEHLDGEIVYECHPRLVEIMRHSFPGLSIYGTRKIPSDQVFWPQWEEVNAKIPILGLGEYFRTQDSDFPRKPYLVSFEEKVKSYQEKFSSVKKPVIGFSWKGGSALTRHDLRSIPLEMFIEGVIKRFDAHWVSLQYDPAARIGWNTPIVADAEKRFGVEMHHDEWVVNDLDECYGGLIHALDHVVTVNTSLVHACGAYGVDCTVLTPSRPAWRYNIEGEEMIWYGDNVRQLRQKEGDWEPVLSRLVAELEEKFSD